MGSLTVVLLLILNLCGVVMASRPKSYKWRLHKWEDGYWQLNKKMDGNGCRGNMINAMMVALGIRYNKKWCFLEGGSHTFDNLDINVLDHYIWPDEREYGRFLWVFEIQTPTTTIVCYESESKVVPLKTPSSKKAKRN